MAALPTTVVSAPGTGTVYPGTMNAMPTYAPTTYTVPSTYGSYSVGTGNVQYPGTAVVASTAPAPLPTSFTGYSGAAALPTTSWMQPALPTVQPMPTVPQSYPMQTYATSPYAFPMQASQAPPPSMPPQGMLGAPMPTILTPQVQPAQEPQQMQQSISSQVQQSISSVSAVPPSGTPAASLVAGTPAGTPLAAGTPIASGTPFGAPTMPMASGAAVAAGTPMAGTPCAAGTPYAAGTPCAAGTPMQSLPTQSFVALGSQGVPALPATNAVLAQASLPQAGVPAEETVKTQSKDLRKGKKTKKSKKFFGICC
mmetsp:Transcript_41892/g.99745  ORF Transcript_41892/g.99745 Transcript_41892/m.99745 type:complete len:311 (-) Transcript_41892:60-992(-)